MKFVQKLFSLGYIGVLILFFLSAVALIVFAGFEFWHAIQPDTDESWRTRFVSILECIGLLTIAVAALELGQTVLEEEIQRSTPISAPTRARRFLSRFMVVVIVSLSIECLVAVFNFVHDEPELLPQASAIGMAAGLLLAAWGLFIRLNVPAEELEPHALQDAKEEDKKLET